MTRPTRRSVLQWTTLLLSVALAATLGATIYLATSSLPYLATSPSTDPTFGALNACLHLAVPSRTGFAVGRDARRAAAWSDARVAVCTLGTDSTRREEWALSGVTVGAFDEAGVLWVVSQPGGLASTVLRLAGPAPTAFGESAAVAMTGTSTGVVVLENSGRLVSLDAAGHALGITQVPSARGLRLSASADGRRVALIGDGAVRVFEAATLALTRGEAPCDVEQLWWSRTEHLALLRCRPDGLTLIFNADTGEQETAERLDRAPSTLAGPDGPYVEPCDLLPCTSAAPGSPQGHEAGGVSAP